MMQRIAAALGKRERSGDFEGRDLDLSGGAPVGGMKVGRRVVLPPDRRDRDAGLSGAHTCADPRPRAPRRRGERTASADGCGSIGWRFTARLGPIAGQVVMISIALLANTPTSEVDGGLIEAGWMITSQPAVSSAPRAAGAGATSVPAVGTGLAGRKIATASPTSASAARTIIAAT
jgi:hypothetical protein